jgi:pimeloyl-ACP methyl ester carboxylesterase
VADHRACARGSGATRFRSTETPRDGRGVALAGDALDLMDALGLHGVPVVGHDWGARVAYTVAAVAPERVGAIAALALPYQPRGVFTVPAFQLREDRCLDPRNGEPVRDATRPPPGRGVRGRRRGLKRVRAGRPSAR